MFVPLSFVRNHTRTYADCGEQVNPILNPNSPPLDFGEECLRRDIAFLQHGSTFFDGAGAHHL